MSDKSLNESRKIVVIGGGPAGLFAAISSARCGARVTVLEKQPKPNRKLLAAGGGRCNITNTLSTEEFSERFGPAGRFMSYALREPVGLRTREKWPGVCAGITIPNVHVKIAERGFRGRTGSGDLLFTNNGISGPPVMDISASVCRLRLPQESVKLNIQLCKDHQTPEDWRKLFLAWRGSEGKHCVHNAVGSILPNRLATVLCAECGIPDDMIIARLPGPVETQLIAVLSETTLNITKSDGFDHAMVASGGVLLKEVESFKQTDVRLLLGRRDHGSGRAL